MSLLGSIADVQLLTRSSILQQNPESRREKVSVNAFPRKDGVSYVGSGNICGERCLQLNVIKRAQPKSLKMLIIC